DKDGDRRRDAVAWAHKLADERSVVRQVSQEPCDDRLGLPPFPFALGLLCEVLASAARGDALGRKRATPAENDRELDALADPPQHLRDRALARGDRTRQRRLTLVVQAEAGRERWRAL